MNSYKLVPIGLVEKSATEEPLNHELISRQLKKIVTDPVFSGSPILCKILSYVVNETLLGNTNKIKEYTIAVNVLNKPKDFDTQLNGVVRIHVCRLRKVLSNYYEKRNADDAVIISIPPGRYVPVFKIHWIMVDYSAYNIGYRQATMTAAVSL